MYYKIKNRYFTSLNIKLILFLLLPGLILTWTCKLSYAGFPDFVWAIQAGGDIWNDTDTGYSITVDSSGNSYIAGKFIGDAYFGDTLIQVRRISTFIAKVSPSGQYIWVRHIAGSGITAATAIDLYEDTYPYITGYFTDTVTIGDDTLISDGNSDIFIARLDSDGNFLWASQAGGTGQDISGSIAVDSLGNAYITGRFFLSASFGDTNFLSNGDHDIFIAKLNSIGAFEWAVKAGGVGGVPG